MNFDIARRRHRPGKLFHPGVPVAVDLGCAIRLGYAESGERQHQSRKREFIANHYQIVVPLFSMRVVQSLKSCRSFKESTGFSRAVQALKYCSALAGEGTHPQTPAGAEAQSNSRSYRHGLNPCVSLKRNQPAHEHKTFCYSKSGRLESIRFDSSWMYLSLSPSASAAKACRTLLSFFTDSSNEIACVRAPRFGSCSSASSTASRTFWSSFT